MFTFAFVVVFALSEASDDHGQIESGIEPDHSKQFAQRACLAIAVMLVFGTLMYALACAAMFSMVFKFTLNKMRNLSWLYISPSNQYDWQFLSLVMGYHDRDIVKDNWEVLKHSHKVKLAGAAQYCFEFIIVVLTFIIL